MFRFFHSSNKSSEFHSPECLFSIIRGSLEEGTCWNRGPHYKWHSLVKGQLMEGVPYLYIKCQLCTAIIFKFEGQLHVYNMPFLLLIFNRCCLATKASHYISNNRRNSWFLHISWSFSWGCHQTVYWGILKSLKAKKKELNIDIGALRI